MRLVFGSSLQKHAMHFHRDDFRACAILKLFEPSLKKKLLQHHQSHCPKQTSKQTNHVPFSKFLSTGALTPHNSPDPKKNTAFFKKDSEPVKNNVNLNTKKNRTVFKKRQTTNNERRTCSSPASLEWWALTTGWVFGASRAVPGNTGRFRWHVQCHREEVAFW